jgi:MFS family permease
MTTETTEISLTPKAAGSTDRTRWFALALIIAAQFMVVLDVAIVNVALPSIRTDLHFSQESLQWVITAYSICVVVARRPGSAVSGAAARPMSATAPSTTMRR